MMVYGLKCPLWVEGDKKGAMIYGFGGRNDGAIVAIEGIMASLKLPLLGHTPKQRCRNIGAFATACYM